MTVLSHIDTLNKRSNKLTKDIHDAYVHYTPDENIREMKKRRLRIKEEIEVLSKRLRKRQHETVQ